MTGSISHLLLLYVALLLFNVGLTGVLWYRQRASLHRDLFRVWAACTLSFMGQGLLQRGAFPITLGFGVTFLATVALAELLARLTDVPFRRMPFVVAMLVAVLVSGGLAWLDASFTAISLPVAIAVAAPLLVTAVRVLLTITVVLSTGGRVFVVSCLAFTAHNLDFPFLRDRPELAPLGFTVAVLIVFALSITSNALVLERVAEDRARIEELSRVRSQFFANISHELRTPLTLILGPLEALFDARLEPPERRLLESVRRNAHRLLRLIDDLLDLAMLEAGTLKLEVTAVDLAAIAKRVVENALPAAEAKRSQLDLRVEGALPPVFGDSHRVEIILTNLVGNALRHTPEGTHVDVRVMGTGDRVIVEVADDGPGIRPEDQARIFERFVQVDGTATRAHGGAGIGLAFARELAELHGGSLTVQSAPGEGATFRLVLWAGKERGGSPASTRPPSSGEALVVAEIPSPAHDESGEASEPASGRVSRPASESDAVLFERGRRPRILLAEDEAELRAFIAELLSTEYDVVATSNGEAAWQAYRQRRPDLVLTDVMMPRSSGTDLCRKIKADTSFAAPPVLLLTARTGTDAALEGYHAGADDFVSKPFHPRVLLARVRAQLRVRQLGLQLADQARLVSAGVLAAGVAHEVRNPMNAILNACRVLEAGGSSRVPSQRLLEVIVDGIHRIDDVISALDDHARPADGDKPSLCDVKVAVESTLRLLGHRMEGVTAHREYRTKGRVLAPARAFNQVLLNLLDNAVRSGARNLWVEVRDDGHHVEVTIDDDGPGVPPYIASHVFDPFFTTRPEGEGTGLGLFLSRRMARDAGGDLRLEERPGGGARFVLTMPRIEAGRSSMPPAASA